MDAELADMVELSWEEGARLIDTCADLCATEVRELEELTLSLTLVAAKAQALLVAGEDTGPLAALRAGGRPIEQDETCRMFQVGHTRARVCTIELDYKWQRG
jgi:hypothetical protein